jgi:hypothetical protein
MGNNEILNEIEIVKYEQEEIKKKIEQVYNQISVLSEYIYEIAKEELDRIGYKLMYRDRDGKEYPEIDEEIEWYYISTEWDCPKSPFGFCMYHKIHDPSYDCCEFCGDPLERK